MFVFLLFEKVRSFRNKRLQSRYFKSVIRFWLKVIHARELILWPMAVVKYLLILQDLVAVDVKRPLVVALFMRTVSRAAWNRNKFVASLHFFFHSCVPAVSSCIEIFLTSPEKCSFGNDKKHFWASFTTDSGGYWSVWTMPSEMPYLFKCKLQVAGFLNLRNILYVNGILVQIRSLTCTAQLVSFLIGCATLVG